MAFSFFSKDVTVLDIGTEKLTLVIGEKINNGVFNIKVKQEIEYAGFKDAEWYEPEKLQTKISKLVSKAESQYGKKIKSIYVGVPGEFCRIDCKEVSLDLPGLKTVTEEDIQELYDKGNVYQSTPYESIICSPIYYILNNSNKRQINIIGDRAVNIKGMLSYVLCKKDFIKRFEAIFHSLKINVNAYMSTPWAAAMYLFTPTQRDNYAILVDVGHLTTTVSVVRGDGLLHMLSFSLGGGYIAGDFVILMGLSYPAAIHLRDSIDLSLIPDHSELYEVLYKQETYHVSMVDIYEAVYDRIQDLASYIKKSMDLSEYDYPKQLPIYLTGGGLSYMRGAPEYLSRLIKKPVEIISPKIPSFNRPEYSSTIGLLDAASNDKQNNKNIFKKIISKLGG